MKITTTFQQRYQHLIFAISPTKIWYFPEPFSTPLFFVESAAALTTRAPWIPPRKSSTPAPHPIHRHQHPGIGCCRWNFLFSILPNSEGSDFVLNILSLSSFRLYQERLARPRPDGYQNLETFQKQKLKQKVNSDLFHLNQKLPKHLNFTHIFSQVTRSRY